jgi:GNAT superfamily N-acetyltransferase
MEVQIRTIKENDYTSFYKMQYTYLDRESFEDFQTKAQRFHDLYMGAFDQDKLLGIVYGHIGGKEGYPVLQGICVDLDRGIAGQGIGTKLLKAFENAIQEKGYANVTVGSTNDFKVERFYMKNGWYPIQLVIKVRGKDVPEDYQQILAVEASGAYISEPHKDNTTFRIETNDYEKGQKVRAVLIAKLHAHDGIFIFKKDL